MESNQEKNKKPGKRKHNQLSRIEGGSPKPKRYKLEEVVQEEYTFKPDEYIFFDTKRVCLTLN